MARIVTSACFRSVASLACCAFLVGTAHAEGATAPSAAQLATRLDAAWVLIAAVLVFFMQAGFKCLEVGLTQKKSATSVAMKNLIDWVVATPFYFLIGFGLMFGHSCGGVVGTDLFGLRGIDGPGAHALGATFFLFQLAFAGTSTTIISGALSERSSFASYLVGSVVVSTFIYPVMGHWVWGGAFFSGESPWLARLGFVDFAGSTVVHSTGGWISLVGAKMLGPRRARFGNDGEPRSLRSHSLAYATLGVFILWFSWWGFNGGSTLAFDENVGPIILNTNLSAAMGGLVAFAHAHATARHEIGEKFLGGVLAGLVAITAGCHLVTPLGSLAVGALAGLVHNLAYDLLLRRMRIDDPVGAIPVHGFCGVLGTLCVAVFGRAERLPHAFLHQLGVQLVGVLACAAWSMGCAYVMYVVLRATIGLRVTPAEEEVGVTLSTDFSEEVLASDSDPTGVRTPGRLGGRGGRGSRSR